MSHVWMVAFTTSNMGIFFICTLFSVPFIENSYHFQKINMSLQFLFVTNSLKEHPSFVAAQGLDNWHQVEMSVAKAKWLCEIPMLRGLVYQSPNAQTIVMLQEQVSYITFKPALDIH